MRFFLRTRIWDSDNDDNDELLMVAESESLRADIQYISEPVERKYLRFHSPGLQSSFTQLFRFRAEEMPRLLHCLRMAPWFQLDNRGWVNSQEGLLVYLRLLVYPIRLIDVEHLFGWEASRLSRIRSWVSASCSKCMDTE